MHTIGGKVSFLYTQRQRAAKAIIEHRIHKQSLEYTKEHHWTKNIGHVCTCVSLTYVCILEGYTRREGRSNRTRNSQSSRSQGRIHKKRIGSLLVYSKSEGSLLVYDSMTRIVPLSACLFYHSGRCGLLSWYSGHDFSLSAAPWQRARL